MPALHRAGRRSGATLMEAAVSMGLIGMVSAVVCSVWVSSISAFGKTTSQSLADTNAVIAMQHIVDDVREAKRFDTPSTSRLRLTFPVLKEDGSYDRMTADVAHPVDYYMSDETGLLGHTGTCLWRNQTGRESRIVARSIESIRFERYTDSSIYITVVTKSEYTPGKASRTQLTERVVYLRNY